MINMNLQYFGGRGSAGGNNPESNNKIPSGGRISNITDASSQRELNEKIKSKGLVLDSAYQRATPGEKVVLYRQDKDGNIINRYVGTYNEYLDGGREIVNIQGQPLFDEIRIGNRVWRVNPDGSQTEITKRRK